MDSDRIAAEFFLNRVSGQFALASAIFRAMSGLVFGYFGVTKLADLSGTASQFYAMGLPAGRTLPLLVALLETFGGLALVVGLLTRLFAGLLALEMVGACFATLHIISGRAAFLLLPVFMLVLMVFVLWSGPAAWSLDERLVAWLARSPWSVRLGLARRLGLGPRFAEVAGGLAEAEDPAERRRRLGLDADAPRTEAPRPGPDDDARRSETARSGRGDDARGSEAARSGPGDDAPRSTPPVPLEPDEPAAPTEVRPVPPARRAGARRVADPNRHAADPNQRPDTRRVGRPVPVDPPTEPNRVQPPRRAR